ncbi:MAG TPA: response regulator transcription factor [Dongiaceae bacterium]|jgi:DNA-binding NarL/FixJ family response regulator|nr:response regulator transcription factor [Dongiaceae bacterium]
MRILIADDHDLVRDTIEEFLKRLGDQTEVLQAATLPEAMTLVTQQTDKLDMILLDLRMPGMNGLAGLTAMRQKCPDVPVVILSGDVNPDVVRGALQAGAAGFIPKTMRGAAMLNAIRLVQSGGRYVPDVIVTNGAANLLEAGARSPKNLTPRERQVLSQLVKGQSNKEIGRALNIEEITVALHLRSVYRKLEVSTRTQAVRIALQLGWDG